MASGTVTPTCARNLPRPISRPGKWRGRTIAARMARKYSSLTATGQAQAIVLDPAPATARLQRTVTRRVRAIEIGPNSGTPARARTPAMQRRQSRASGRVGRSGEQPYHTDNQAPRLAPRLIAAGRARVAAEERPARLRVLAERPGQPPVVAAERREQPRVAEEDGVAAAVGVAGGRISRSSTTSPFSAVST